VLENPAVPVELTVLVVVLVQDHRPGLLAVALKTKSVIAAHHPGQVPLLGAEEDLAAAVAETTRAPAAAEAAKAWAVADTAAAAEAAGTVVAVAAEAAVGAEVVVGAEDAAAAAAADDDDKATVDKEKTNEIKNRYYHFVESFRDCLRDRWLLLVRLEFERGSTVAIRRSFADAASTKTIRHTETSSRRPCRSRIEF
jgi:hypothetical protein